MLNALVLVCSLAVTPDVANCTRHNAVHVLQVLATFASPVSCLMHGQAYLATTAIGDELRTDERVKVVCAPTTSSTAAGPAPAIR